MAVERGRFAKELACDAAGVVPGRTRLVRWCLVLERALQRIIDGLYPAFHVDFRGCLIYTAEMRSYDLKAEPAIRIASFSDRRHAQVNRIHVPFKTLLPINVLRQPSLIKDDPVPVAISCYIIV